MRQPVSRNSFDRLHGYLGVYLQEGAPLVDAFWNEAIDVQWSLLRDAIRDAGLEGTAGIEFRIDPVEGGRGGFVACGGPGRFYCGGLPVLWPSSRLIDVLGSQPHPVAQGREGPDAGRPDLIYLEAWVGVVDSLDLPDLDDPGLGTERGTFRTIVRSRIHAGHPREHCSNLQLTVRGSYGDDRNALYRVELLAVHERDRCASLLWDSAAASTTALVAQRAAAHTTQVVLGNAQGFAPGNYVRFEGHGLAQSHHGVPDLYRVTGRTDQTITIERHDCRAVSLVDCTCMSGAKLSGQGDGAVLQLELEDDPSSVTLHELRPRRLVKELPANTRSALAAAGELGKALQAYLDASGATSWLVMTVDRHPENDAEQPADSPRKITVRFAPDGLTTALDPWNTEHASTLAVAAHPFQTCIEVDRPASVHAQQTWTEGMQIQIGDGSKTQQPTTALQFADTESGQHCKPGNETVQVPELRRVVHIVHHPHEERDGAPGSTMTLILSEPLSCEYKAHAPVVPARPIRARRYEGHACAVPVDTVDPSVDPARKHIQSPYDLGGKQPLVPTGLSLLLSVEETSLVGIPGDGWTFAARAGGWVERPIFAPVDEVQRGCAPLAKLRWREDGSVKVTDVRPVPAPHAHHGWLADIADTADELAASTHAEHAESVARIARRADGKRAQRDLVHEIGLLAEDFSGWASPHTARGRAVRLLQAAVTAVHKPELPEAHHLSRIASAMERLASAVAMAEREPAKHGEPHPGPGSAAGAPPAPAPTQKASPDPAAPPPAAVHAPPAVAAQLSPATVQAPSAAHPSPAAAPAPTADTARPLLAAVVQAPPVEVGQAPSHEELPHTAGDEPPVMASDEPASAAAHDVPADAHELGASAYAEPEHTGADDACEVVPDEPRIAASTGQAFTSATAVLDIAGLPTRLVHSNRALAPGQRRKWPTLRDVPPPSTLQRGQERRLAEAVAQLLEQTAEIGRRALAGEDRAALHTALNGLWKSRFELNKLERPIRVEDAIAFHDSRPLAAGGKP